MGQTIADGIAFAEHAPLPDVWETVAPSIRMQAYKEVRACKMDIAYQAGVLCRVLRIAESGGYPSLRDAGPIRARLEAAVRVAGERGRKIAVHYYQLRRTVGVKVAEGMPAPEADGFILTEHLKGGERIVIASSFSDEFDFSDRLEEQPAP